MNPMLSQAGVEHGTCGVVGRLEARRDLMHNDAQMALLEEA